MGNKSNRRKPKKPRFGVSKIGSSSSNFGLSSKRTHNTRLSSRRAVESKRKKTKAPIINPHIDGFGNSIRKNIYQSKAVEGKTSKVSHLTLRKTISKLRGYNTTKGYKVVAIQGEKNKFENHLVVLNLSLWSVSK